MVFYYLLIGGGPMLAAWGQALGETLMLCGALMLLLASSGCKRWPPSS
ncbi:hypothetical protein [Pseudomonas brassicacearum]|nr:hypothetical protein [Pseudomonas brassicacearum]